MSMVHTSISIRVPGQTGIVASTTPNCILGKHDETLKGDAETKATQLSPVVEHML